jgi:hypothetical protein
VNFIRNEPFERQTVTSFACGTRAILLVLAEAESRVSGVRRSALSNNPLRDSLPANLSTLRHNCTYESTHARLDTLNLNTPARVRNETHYEIRDGKAMQISSFLPEIRHSVSVFEKIASEGNTWILKSRFFFRFSPSLKRKSPRRRLHF